MAEVKVVKTSIALPPIYKEKIKRGAKKLQISQSELIRRAIDDYLAKLGLEVIPSFDSDATAEKPKLAQDSP